MLQVQNKELDKLFAMNARDATSRVELSSQRMESVTESMYDIAKTTEKDTTSMHIITLVTLLFLPGTFLGVRSIVYFSKLQSGILTDNQTFFSTPIFGGGDGGSDGQESRGWFLNEQLLWLFMKICFPMMLVTIGGWFAYMKYKSRGRSRTSRRGEGMV